MQKIQGLTTPFHNEDQMKQKIEILKQEVYPKKKKKFELTHSQKKFAIRKSITKLPSCQPMQKKKDQKNASSERIKNEQLMKKTTIQFSTINKERKNERIMPWTVQSWFPTSRSTSHLHRRKPTSFREAGQAFQFEPKSQSLQQKSLKHFKNRDTQTLLRKNSLFLLNFIRTRQKRNKIAPHVGQSPLVFNERPTAPLLTSHKSPPVHEEPAKKEKKKKPMLHIPRREQIEDQYSERNYIYPEPW